MSVDNRIPSEPYMELNGVTVYAENDNKPFGRIKSHDLSEISKGTIGEKLMDKEYNGLGTHGTMGVERVNELIDELITYMDEGDSITITGTGDRTFDVFINSTRIQKPKTDDVGIIKAANDTVAVRLGDGRIVNMDAKGEAGVSHKLGVYGIGRTPELNDLIYGKGVIDGQEH